MVQSTLVTKLACCVRGSCGWRGRICNLLLMHNAFVVDNKTCLFCGHGRTSEQTVQHTVCLVSALVQPCLYAYKDFVETLNADSLNLFKHIADQEKLSICLGCTLPPCFEVNVSVSIIHVQQGHFTDRTCSSWLSLQCLSHVGVHKCRFK